MKSPPSSRPSSSRGPGRPPKNKSATPIQASNTSRVQKPQKPKTSGKSLEQKIRTFCNDLIDADTRIERTGKSIRWNRNAQGAKYYFKGPDSTYDFCQEKEPGKWSAEQKNMFIRAMENEEV